LRCNNCLFIFDKRIPTVHQLDKIYSKYSYSERRQCSPATIISYEVLLDKFQGFRVNSRILDVGCGQGDFLRTARKRGWQVYGTEYSQAAVKLLLEDQINVVQGALTEKTFINFKFDIITSFEVFEHINNASDEIKLIQNKIRPGGLFYLTTPNFNSILRYLEQVNFKIIAWPEHISFYTPSSLRYLAESNGMQTKKIVTTGIDPKRLKAFFRLDRDQYFAQSNSMEIEAYSFREKIQKSIFLRFTKEVINWFLNLFGVGDTIKAWFVKPVESNDR
jgi:2-polyprenyl-3-methyl-5-hydroxy-6-metoxy-1,4-benzoquinol methylase